MKHSTTYTRDHERATFFPRHGTLLMFDGERITSVECADADVPARVADLLADGYALEAPRETSAGRYAKQTKREAA